MTASSNIPPHGQRPPAPPSTSSRKGDPFAWVATSPYFQAGLAGYSDSAMRLIARRHGCPYCITEAMLDQLLIHGGKGLRIAHLEESDHPIAGQLMGSHPQDIAAGARILVDLGYDVVDINLACPVKKIKKKSRGGHLLSVPDEAIEILVSAHRAVGHLVPLTVKLRRGYVEGPDAEADFHRIIQAAIDIGFTGTTVHGRTVAQKYIGPSRWAFLRQLTRTYRSAMDRGFHIFGSGDIFSPQAIFDMIQQTQVQAVSVARGCIGNPWIFHQAAQLQQGLPLTPPTIPQQREVLLEHFQLSLQLHGESNAGRMMRKFGIKFAVHHPQSQQVAEAFIAVKSLADWRSVLDRFY